MGIWMYGRTGSVYGPIRYLSTLISIKVAWCRETLGELHISAVLGRELFCRTCVESEVCKIWSTDFWLESSALMVQENGGRSNTFHESNLRKVTDKLCYTDVNVVKYMKSLSPNTLRLCIWFGWFLCLMAYQLL